MPGTATYTVTADTRLRGITAFRLETLTHPSLPGTGPGRGFGLGFILIGAAVLVMSAIAYAYRPLRHLEDDLPDVAPDEAAGAVSVPGIP